MRLLEKKPAKEKRKRKRKRKNMKKNRMRKFQIKSVSKPHPRPSHVEESVHESNADGVVRQELKRLKIGGCSFKDFKYFGPKELYGDKGAITIVRWLEEMESIVIISKCSDQGKIQYSAKMFKGEALEWWNTMIMSKGR